MDVTTCTIVAGVITCVFAPGPRPTAAEAAAILAPRQFVYVAPIPPRPPIYVARTVDHWPEPRPRRRLDGTLLTDPVQVYGVFPWWPIGYGRETRGIHERRR